MPKFEQFEVSPEKVASELRPSNEGAQAMERAANTEREYTQIGLRMSLHGAAMIGEGIKSFGHPLDELGRLQNERDNAVAHSTATNMATQVDVANRYGITAPLGTAGSAGQGSGGGNTGVTVQADGSTDPGVDPQTGKTMPNPHPATEAPGIINNGIEAGLKRIQDAGDEFERHNGRQKRLTIWEPKAAELRKELYGHAAHEQTIADSNAVIKNIDETANTHASYLVQSAAQSPAGAEKELDARLAGFEKDQHTALGGFADIQNDQEKLGILDRAITKSAGALVRSTMLGLSMTPDGIKIAKAMLDSGKYDKYFDANTAEKAKLYEHLGTADSRLYEQAQHARTLRVQGQRDAQSKLLGDAAGKIMSGQWTGEMETSMLARPEFTDGQGGADAEGVGIAHKFLDEVRKAREGTATYVDPVLATRTMNKFLYDIGRADGDPEKLKDFREVQKAYAVDHTIDLKQYQELEKEWTKVQTKSDEGWRTAREAWWKEHEKDFFTPPSGAEQLKAAADGKTVYTHSLLGAERASKARAELERQAAEMRAKGEDPTQLLDPNSPKYFGKNILPVTQEEEAIYRGKVQAKQTEKTTFFTKSGDMNWQTEVNARTIRTLESGSENGNYQAVSKPTTYSSGQVDYAYGAYGIMGVNVKAWTKEVLGREMTPQEFLQDRAAQDKVFEAKFGQLVKKHGGDVQEAAHDWFGHGKNDAYGTTPDGYMEKFMRVWKGIHDYAVGENGIFPGKAQNDVPQGNPAAVSPVSELPAPRHTAYQPGVLNAVTNESARTINDQGYGARMTGSVTIGNATFQFETGGRGRGSAPLGTYTITRYTPGRVRYASGQSYTADAFELTDARDTAPATQGQAPRQGLLIHEWQGGQSLGCLEIPTAQWPAFKQALIAELQRNPNGVKLNLGTPHQTVVSQRSYSVPNGFNAPNYLHNPDTGQFFDTNTGKLFDAQGHPVQ